MYTRIVSMEYAQGVALQAAPGNIDEVSMAISYGVMYYKIYISNVDGRRTYVEVDAKTGNILKVDYLMYTRIISMEYAQSLALQQVPGKIDRMSAEMSHGVMYYKVYILTEDNKRFYVEVDTNSGRILRVKEVIS